MFRFKRYRPGWALKLGPIEIEFWKSAMEAGYHLDLSYGCKVTSMWAGS